jgi:hypothetical protein
MGIYQDGMSAVLLAWNPCSIRHPLMGISLDGISKTRVLLMKCSMSNNGTGTGSDAHNPVTITD